MRLVASVTSSKAALGISNLPVKSFNCINFFASLLLSRTEVLIQSDSMYVIGTMRDGWKRNTNHDLWAIMDSLVEKVKVIWQHVKGHEGDKWNSLCDALAVAASNYRK